MPEAGPDSLVNGSKIVKLGSQLDLNHLEELFVQLKSYYAERDLVLDFSDVLDMDTAAVQLLIAFKKSFPEVQKLKLINISSGLENVWEIIGVKKILLK